MRVEELIEKLQEMDPDAVVNIPSVDNEGYVIDRIAKHAEQIACGWDDIKGECIYEVFIE